MHSTILQPAVNDRYLVSVATRGFQGGVPAWSSHGDLVTLATSAAAASVSSNSALELSWISVILD